MKTKVLIELVLKSPKGRKIALASFENGCLIDARMGNLSGEEAFYGMMGEKEGFFEFYRAPVALNRILSKIDGATELNEKKLVYTLNSGNILQVDPLMPGESVHEKLAELFNGKLTTPDSPATASVAHAGCRDTAKRIKNLLELNFSNLTVSIAAIGAAFGARCGPDSVVAAFCPILE